MQKTVVALICLFIGYMLADGRTVLRAQEAQDAPPRWEQMCEMKGGLGSGAARTRAIASINESVATRGREGWEIAAMPVYVAANANGGGGIWSDMMICYRRRAP